MLVYSSKEEIRWSDCRSRTFQESMSEWPWKMIAFEEKRTHMLWMLVRLDHSGRDPLIELLFKILHRLVTSFLWLFPHAQVFPFHLWERTKLLTCFSNFSDWTILGEIHWFGCKSRTCIRSISLLFHSCAAHAQTRKVIWCDGVRYSHCLQTS